MSNEFKEYMNNQRNELRKSVAYEITIQQRYRDY